ncbi:MAG: hypothetical protein ACE5OS_09855, partial [Anaerolineae bacterium]
CSRRRRSAPAEAPAYPHRPEEPAYPPEEPVLDRVQRRLFTAARPTQPCSRRRRSAPAEAPTYPHRPEEPVLDHFRPRLFTAARPTQPCSRRGTRKIIMTTGDNE